MNPLARLSGLALALCILARFAVAIGPHLPLLTIIFALVFIVALVID